MIDAGNHLAKTCRLSHRSHPRRTFRNTTISRNSTHLPRTSRVRAEARISVGGPFGEVVKKTGDASGLPFRFSTKYQDEETGIVMYPARPYNPFTGRWLSKDPVEEQGGLNLYTFCNNNTINKVDFIGLQANTCAVASIQLLGTLDRTTISNFDGDNEEYLVNVSVTISFPRPVPPLPGPGNPPGQGTGTLGPFPTGLHWLPMNANVPDRSPCRKKNMCKGTCKNPCCQWPHEWQEGYLAGQVSSQLVNIYDPVSGYQNAKCNLYINELADGLKRCKASNPSCQ